MSSVTIIVPVYNAEKTLNKCIDSIIQQTFTDWELLLINDGSEDKSEAICNEYSRIDFRIRIFNKKNGGVSSARNVGLDHAKGKWVTFVDSDDWIKPDYINNLLAHTDEDTDLVISYAEVFNDEVGRIENYPSRKIINGEIDEIFIENDMHWHTSPWSKLYRRSVIDKYKLRFCEGMHIGEDAVFLYSFILKSHVIFISSDTDYCYNAYSEGSLTKRINSLQEEILSYNEIYNVVDKLINFKGIKDANALYNLYWLVASYQRRLLNALYYNKSVRSVRVMFIKSNSWYAYINYTKAESLKERFLIYLLRHKLFSLYDFVRVVAVGIHNHSL